MHIFSINHGVFDSLHRNVDFCVEAAKLDFALELKRLMDQEDIKNIDLARRLEVSQPMVSKLLRGDANVTIETMVKASKAVDGDLFIKIIRSNCTARLFEIVKAEHSRSPQNRFVKNLSRTAGNEHSSDWTNFFNKATSNEEKPIAA